MLLDSNALLPSGCRLEPSALDLQTLHLHGLDVWTAWFHTTPTASYSVVWRGLCHLLFVVESTSHTCFFVTAKHHQQTSILRIRTINHINYMSCGNLFHFLADFPIKIWVSTMKYCHPFSTSPWGSMGLEAPPPYTRGPKVSGVLGQRVLVPKLSGPRINQPSGIVL